MVGQGEDISAFESFTLEDAGGDKAAPSAGGKAKEEASQSSEAADSKPSAPKAAAPPPAETESSGGRLQSALDRLPNASFDAVRLAFDSKVNLTSIKGTGAGGQITVDDVKKATAGAAAPSSDTPVASYEDIPTSSMRSIIAARLLESTNQNPHFFVSAAVSVTKLLALRAALNGAGEGKYKLSVNDFLIKGCAIACKKVPAVNSSWRDGFIRQYNNVDVSVSHKSSHPPPNSHH